MADVKKNSGGKKVVEKVKAKVEKVKAERPRPLKTVARPNKAAATRPNRAKLLISIVNQKDDLRLKEVIDEYSVALSFSFAGRGTARSAVLDYLGIGETEKSVIFSLFPESDEEAILREIQAQMSLYLVGRGISFTVPLTAVSQIVANGLISAATQKTVDRSRVMSNEDRKFDLIVAVVDSNCTDDAMEAARSAGAAGGTIVRARTLSNDKAEQFIGISLAADQEILLILSKRDAKTAIMQALSDKAGLKTEAGGVIFSLPVDRTAGIGVEVTEHEQKTESAEKSAETVAESTEEKESVDEENNEANEQ